jgi:hypothetical protein
VVLPEFVREALAEIAEQKTPGSDSYDDARAADRYVIYIFNGQRHSSWVLILDLG